MLLDIQIVTSDSVGNNEQTICSIHKSNQIIHPFRGLMNPNRNFTYLSLHKSPMGVTEHEDTDDPVGGVGGV